jgi:hypothetical protein
MHASTLFQFSSFSSRLITYLVILLLGVLGLVFFSVNRSTYNNTRDVIDQNLELGLDVFNQLITERGDNFNTTMRALSSDFAFRTAYETSDYDTLLSVGDNLLARTENADILMMVDYDYLVWQIHNAFTHRAKTSLGPGCFKQLRTTRNLKPLPLF